MEKLRDNLPLASVVLLTLGALNLIYFYGFFNIEICSYIDLTEIFILSLPFFLKGAMVLIPIALLAPVTIDVELGKLKTDDSTAKQGTAILGYSVFAFMFLFLYVMYTGYLDFTLTWDIVLAFIPIILFPYLINWASPVFARTTKKAFGIEVGSGFMPFLFGIIIISAFSITLTRHSARNIAYKKNFAFAEVQIDSVTIHSDSTYRYLGKTKNFIFFFNTKTSKSDAFPLLNAKRVTVTDDHFFDGILLHPKKK